MKNGCRCGSSSAGKAVSGFSMRTRGSPNAKPNRIEREQVRVAYCGQLYAGVVLGHRDRMEVTVGETYGWGRIRGPRESQEARLTLVFALLLQRLLEHYFWQPEAFLKEVHQGLAEVLPCCFTVNEVAFVWVDLRHKEETDMSEVRYFLSRTYQWIPIIAQITGREE